MDAVERVAAGGTVLDPDVVAHFLGRHSTRDRLSTLTDREREVLGLMGEGRSNGAIARRLVVGDKTVESHVASISPSSGSALSRTITAGARRSRLARDLNRWARYHQ